MIKPNRISDIDEFEKQMKQSAANYSVILKGRIIGIALTAVIIVGFFMVPKSTWLIPSRFTSEDLNPYADPVQVDLPKNISATDLRNRSDYEKLVKIKSLQNRQVYYILPLAKYSLTGRVAAKNRFFFNQSIFDKVALVDFGIVWGDMVKDEYFKMVYTYSSEYLNGSRMLLVGLDRKWLDKIPYEEAYRISQYLFTHASHTHVIPANKNVMKALKAVRRGQIVKIEGYLIDMYDLNFYRFAMSSLSRYDNNEGSRGAGKGGGACEIMYVTKVQIGHKIFK